MRAAIRCGLLFVALALMSRPASAESTKEQWDAELARVQPLIQARMNEVRELRKATDVFVESLNNLARNNVAKLTPEFKREMAQKRLDYYTRLGTLNAAALEMERTLPKTVSPIARQKVLDALARIRDEIRFTVVSLNHVARSLKDL